MSQKILVIYSKPSQCHIQRFINIVKYDRYTNRKGERQVEDKNSVIVFKNVSFQYQSDASFTLKDVSFNIPKGQWTSIVGHNGSGKSTIAKLMIGIEKVKSGEIFYNNGSYNR